MPARIRTAVLVLSGLEHADPDTVKVANWCIAKYVAEYGEDNA